MVKTDRNIISSVYRIMNYELAATRIEYTVNVLIALKLEALNPKEGTKEYFEMIRRQDIADEYIERTGDERCVAPPEMIGYLRDLDVRELIPE